MALRRLDLRGRTGDRRALRRELPAPAGNPEADAAQVADILAEVRREGDAALRRLTERFDGVRVDELRVPEAEGEAALRRVPAALRRALEVAHDRIAAYHAHEAAAPASEFRSDGIAVRHLVRPVGRAGCYAPGGRARYPSTVLMTAVPARVAGVGEVVLCVPPGPDGRIDDASLAAAALAGVDEVYRVGGAQAIAALAYGTESIEPVDVVVGPGNRYVAEAKRQVSGAVGVSSAFAGPSEVVVVADAAAPADLCAIDLLVQAEHGPDGLAWLVTWSEEVARSVDREVDRLVAGSARRSDLESTLASGGYAVIVDGPEQAAAVIDVVAPEHLELVVDPDVAESLLASVSSAGAVFVGPWSPASVGDYLAGPNHVLPTNRTARFASALRVDDFRRHSHVVTVERPALDELGPSVVTLAECEGLPAHAESVRRRQGRP
ncbi:MAG TPA: histidinol dehydrogenase [Acidimicrobiales bacterium]|nr:histidinol dehydrogenase [Acidimicrobiales bacterium]